jgi:cyanophycin synthetase
VQLINKANEKENSLPPWLRTEQFPMDEIAIKAIHTAGFSIYDVVSKGFFVPLRDIESTKWGGYDENVTDSIHIENIDIAIKSAKLFRLNVAGIDIITPDISKPWHTNGAIINEVNFSPLFGLGEISRGAIPRFLEDYMGGDGRMVVKAFVGKSVAMVEAIKYQRKMAGKRTRAVVLSEDSCFDSKGQNIGFDLDTLEQKIKALYMNSAVDEIALVVKDKQELSKAININELNEILHF